MPRKKKQAPKRTIIAYVLDESGSMATQTDSVREAFNEYLDEVQTNDGTGEILFSLTKFSSSVTRADEPTLINDVPRLQPGDYRPTGSTALLDAVRQTIGKVDEYVDDSTRALIVVMTDGEENASRRTTFEQLNNLITEKQNTGKWTFVFLGADFDVWSKGAQSLGAFAGNTATVSKANPKHTHSLLASATTSYVDSTRGATIDFFGDAGQTEEDYKRVDLKEPSTS